MKHRYLLVIPSLASAAALLVSCSSINQPLSSSDGSNPLDPPGRTSTVEEDPYGPNFTPGTFLQTVSPKTAFFSTFPKGNDQPAKTLPDYTDVKVISSKGSYVKVEVVDSGEVGYVPSVMLGEKRSPNEVPVTPGTGEVPVTPGVAPEPEVPGTPAAEAPSVDPPVAPEPEIPGIEPPEVIDPSKPAE
ncbi:MAG: hypothetical protein CSA62_15535 [Planctomycetota bacterium]|nr:MAG: hypothetical protein CSA62_15535 [Planctomycetota bacterium]